MTGNEFTILKSTLTTRVLHRMHIEGDCRIEVAIGDDGFIQYAAHLDSRDMFVSMVPDHPFVRKVLSCLQKPYRDHPGLKDHDPQ
jgi:hypothetical protein